MSIRRWVVALAAAGLGLAGCSFVVLKMFVEDFGRAAYIGAIHEERVRYAFTDEPTTHPDDSYNSDKISGVTPVEIWGDECHDAALYLLILDADSGRELHRRPLRDRPLCEDDRLLWNGEDLLALDDGLVFGLFGDSWPDDMYVAPFSVASTADDPIVVEHGWSQQFGMSVVERRAVDGVTHFTPATNCAPRARSYRIMVRDAVNNAELARSGLHGYGFCDGRRWLWDGETLQLLTENETWPLDLYEVRE